MKTDREIQKDVMDELKWEPILNATEIGVSVTNGVVTLSGYVDTFYKKMTAENAAWRVKGVTAVAEELEVRLSFDARLTDVQVAENVAHAIKWHTAVPDENIKIKVTDGWVTLEGDVHWNFQKESAFNAVRTLSGVKGVSNYITVKPSVNGVLVKDNIRRALERNADLEAANIKVETLGNKVILKGTAHSWNEKRAVESAVWSAPGVVAIDDQLVIA